MSLFQSIALLFALFMLYVVNIHRRKLALSRVEQLSWYSLWISFVVVSLFPTLLLGITDLINFSRVFDLLVVASLMLLTILVVTNYFLQKENKRKLEQVIRELSIQEAGNARK
ncbi:MAG: hypothetical protein A2632_01340 [Candidatus Pacebacteria bacterium RIFCSPHIGHO2_01_FULL_46_16]|nr:MAG: hypothetical protein A2632_01340 [Candidatus Pacebacteria bacterium RIFCSPHIGHO2_01_FULL_46_16]